MNINDRGTFLYKKDTVLSIYGSRTGKFFTYKPNPKAILVRFMRGANEH